MWGTDFFAFVLLAERTGNILSLFRVSHRCTHETQFTLNKMLVRNGREVDVLTKWAGGLSREKKIHRKIVKVDAFQRQNARFR